MSKTKESLYEEQKLKEAETYAYEPKTIVELAWNNATTYEEFEEAYDQLLERSQDE